MKSCIVTALLIFVMAAGHTASAAEVVTVAGTGQKAYEPDSNVATKTPVGEPYGIAKGPDGCLYICEIANHIVRKLDESTGRLTLVAGNGTQGYSGDGGPATKAQLNEPYEVRFDQAGNIYFVEMKNNLVRKVDAKTGIISTVAGTGQQGFSGDGGPATKATFNRPHSITLDNDGHLYICDIGNHRIRVVDLKSGIVSTFAGTGQRKPTPDGAKVAGTPLNGPRALDFDGKHSLYLALREGNAVYRIDLKSQTLHHLAGTGRKGFTGNGGSAKKATLSGPKGIALAPNGDVYLADTESHTVRVIRAATGVLDVVVGNGKRGDGPDGNPLKCRTARLHGVFVDKAGNVYIGDSENHRVRVFRP
ncbi:MAG: NHL domain-containing protein [Planctomycetota bacterium]|jgi:sugar lactone lactonase YvrE